MAIKETITTSLQNGLEINDEVLSHKYQWCYHYRKPTSLMKVKELIKEVR